MADPDFASKQPGKRDLSRFRLTAALRKQRQRKRLKAEGRKSIELDDLPKELVEGLQRVAEITGGSIKEQAGLILRLAAPAYVRELEQIASRGADLWIRAEPYLAYAAYLSRPGAVFRIHDRVLTNAEWMPIYAELSEIYGMLGRRGYSRQRVEAFLKRAAKAHKHITTQPHKHTNTQIKMVCGREFYWARPYG